jgi:maleate isomerase
MAHSTGRQFTAGARAAKRFATALRDASNAGGWRARIGVVVPSVNTVVEPWFSAASPPGVSVHASRMFLENALTPKSLIRMDKDEGMRAVRQLASCRPHGIAYCCTASSIVQGLEYDRHLQHELEQVAGVPATTATQSILEAMRILGIKRVAAASPYTEEIDRAEHAFFEAAGLEVISSACLGIKDAFELAAPTLRDIHELALRAWKPGAEAMLITCLNLWSQSVVERLETELGVPVITSTQATFWRLLRIAGIDDRIAHYGRLLSEH